MMSSQVPIAVKFAGGFSGFLFSLYLLSIFPRYHKFSGQSQIGGLSSPRALPL